ncbi:MAG: hypothetical protein ABH868_01760 [bacterium]
MLRLLNNKKGVGALLIIVAIMVVCGVLGMTLVFLATNESRARVRSRDTNIALYAADAGIEMAIYKFNQSTGPYVFGGTENFLPDAIYPDGSFIILYSSSPANPGRWVIEATGYSPNATNPRTQRTIEAVYEDQTGSITVTSAVACGGGVDVQGSASVDGGSLSGLTVPPGDSVTVQGSASVTGTPPVSSGTFPTFEEIFGVTSAKMQSMATTTYISPANNSAVSGITWCTGDFQITQNGWSGSGILIVNGDLKITGGTFSGVIYVFDELEVAGNTNIQGAIFCEEIDKIKGSASITFNSAVEQTSEELYPAVLVSWRELL